MIGANLQEDGGHPRPGTRLGRLTADDAQERRQDAAALALPRLSPNRRPLGRRCRRWLQKKKRHFLHSRRLLLHSQFGRRGL